jgi:hypothetical protein
LLLPFDAILQTITVKVPVKYADKTDEVTRVASISGVAGGDRVGSVGSNATGVVTNNAPRRTSFNMEFMSADMFSKPFTFSSGSGPKRRYCQFDISAPVNKKCKKENVFFPRFNPFRKKRGLMNVIAKQTTRSRIVAKSGFLNTLASTEGKTHHFFKDIFITTLDMSWVYVFLMFAVGFFSSWLMFAVLWYLTFIVHGDFLPENTGNASFVPCVAGIKDFTSCFLFSIETQHTIGYGTRYVLSWSLNKIYGGFPCNHMYLRFLSLVPMCFSISILGSWFSWFHGSVGLITRLSWPIKFDPLWNTDLSASVPFTTFLLRSREIFKWSGWGLSCLISRRPEIIAQKHQLETPKVQ